MFELKKNMEQNFELKLLDRLLVISRHLVGRAVGWWCQARYQTHTHSDFAKLFLDHFSDQRLKKMKLRRLQGITYNHIVSTTHWLILCMLKRKCIGIFAIILMKETS